ncbi:MAG TPA: GIY-YIG nuclease family protein, partial [Gemmatimonadales bacterium]|nr:GIY-YIG nuclease family protein [Gemmatimonadales bacterium]
MALPPELARTLATLPDRPGVYLWKDARGEILYVGKAKNLRSRVRSSFGPDHEDVAKHQALVRQIATVDTIVVPTEAEALL